MLISTITYIVSASRCADGLQCCSLAVHQYTLHVLLSYNRDRDVTPHQLNRKDPNVDLRSNKLNN